MENKYQESLDRIKNYFNVFDSYSGEYIGTPFDDEIDILQQVIDDLELYKKALVLLSKNIIYSDKDYNVYSNKDKDEEAKGWEEWALGEAREELENEQ